MASHAAVGVHDNLSSRETAVALRPTDNKTASGIDVVNGMLIEIIRWNHGFDDTIDDGFFELAVFDIRTVLRGDDDALNFDRPAVTILHRYLGLAVGSQEVSFTTFPNLGQILNQAVGHLNGKR